jgi:hypothetical protein
MALDITIPNRVSLPNGGWADLRPVSDITERMRRPIKKLSTQLASHPEFVAAVSSAQGRELTQAEQLELAGAMGGAFDILEELQDRLVCAAVRGWSYPVDISPDGLLDISAAALDALREYAAPYQSALNPDFEPTTESDSPTGPSSV